MRRAEIGHHHHIAGPYLARFAQEAVWREDHKREASGAQVDGSWPWRWRTSLTSISADTGSGAARPNPQIQLMPL
jgi:hypothetical protein